MNQLIYTIIGLLLSCTVGAQAQFQFSQTVRTQQMLNPSYNATRSEVGALLMFRNQWVGMNGAPEIKAAHVRYPLPRKNLAFGFTLRQDNWAFFDKTDVKASIAYRVIFDHDTTMGLSFGITGGVNSLALDKNEMVVNGPEGLTEFNDYEMLFPQVGLGIFFNTERFFLGFSVPEFFAQTANNNKFSYSRQYSVMYLYSGYIVNMGKSVLLKPTILLRQLEGIPMQVDITANVLLKNTIGVGIGWRKDNALLLLSELHFKGFCLSYSYDYSISQLSYYLNSTHEIGLSYDIIKRSTSVKIRYF